MTVRRPLPLTLLAALLVLGPAAGAARAHFLFAHVGPLAEGGRHVEVYFSAEAEAGDPKYVAKIAGTRLWVQAEPGAFRPLDVEPAHDRLRAAVPPSGSLAVVGACEYGVLARPDQTPFLLRYYPKAVAGDPDELNKLVRFDAIPLEVAATFEDGRVKLSKLVDGKPEPGATFMAVDADLEEQSIEAGADGVATWTPPHPGRFSVYTRRDTKVAGEVGGKAYEEIREFATMALDWPLAGAAEGDPEAAEVFEAALAERARWVDFPGFRAEAAGSFDGRPFEGRVEVKADGSAAVEVDDEAASAWVEDQLRSLAMHRVASGDPGPTPEFRFGREDDHDHPLGRLLVVEGGRFASSYRIQGGEITSVNRHIGRQVLTITTLESERNAEGKLLPRAYLVQTWDAPDGRLARTEAVRDRWTRVGGFDLPAGHGAITAADGGQSVRVLTLSGHALLGR